MRKNSNVLNAAEYILQTTSTLKREMMDLGNKNQQISWGIGGLIITLAANLLYTAQEVIQESIKNNDANSRDDILEIKTRFNQFIDQMVENG